jgi:hypothetical protein
MELDRRRQDVASQLASFDGRVDRQVRMLAQPSEQLADVRLVPRLPTPQLMGVEHHCRHLPRRRGCIASIDA